MFNELTTAAEALTAVERVISDLGVLPVTPERLVALVQTLALQVFFLMADNQHLHAEIAAVRAVVPTPGAGVDTVIAQS